MDKSKESDHNQETIIIDWINEMNTIWHYCERKSKDRKDIKVDYYLKPNTYQKSDRIKYIDEMNNYKSYNKKSITINNNDKDSSNNKANKNDTDSNDYNSNKDCIKIEENRILELEKKQKDSLVKQKPVKK
ncbi:3299_t:CDS:2, partial [Dentiscutata heterogama]